MTRKYRLTKSELKEEAQDVIFRVLTEYADKVGEYINQPDGEDTAMENPYTPISPRIRQEDAELMLEAYAIEIERIGKRFNILS